MLETFKYETFSKLDEKKFMIHPESGEALEANLARVDDLSRGEESDPERRKPFSIVFSGPKDKELEQGTYKIEHGTLGTFEIFLVPVVSPQGSEELWYEAVFN